MYYWPSWSGCRPTRTALWAGPVEWVAQINQALKDRFKSVAHFFVDYQLSLFDGCVVPDMPHIYQAQIRKHFLVKIPKQRVNNLTSVKRLGGRQQTVDFDISHKR